MLLGFNIYRARYLSDYGAPVLLAFLLHALLLAAMSMVEFAPPVKQVNNEPVLTFFYQPPLTTEHSVKPEIQAEISAVKDPEIAQPAKAAVDKDNDRHNHEPAKPHAPKKVVVAKALPTIETPRGTQTGTSLAQRALDSVAAPNQTFMQQAAKSSYQQFVQRQQDIKLTVDAKYRKLSTDPAEQVITQLEQGRQLIRTTKGCRIVDPSKHDFEAMMAATSVPCGDEKTTSALLKQALEKHVKR